MNEAGDEREPPNWGLRIALGLLALTLIGACGAVWYVSSRDFTLPFDRPEAPAPDQPRPQPHKDKDGHMVSNAGWRRQPTGEEIARYYPADARQQRVAGRALLDCRVGLDGRMSQCALVSETPPRWGFGEAALRLSEAFVMWSKTVDGKPVAGGEVRIPIVFSQDD